MGFTNLGEFTLRNTIASSALVTGNLFKITPTSEPEFADSKLKTSKFEMIQISETGEAFQVRLVKYESFSQLIYLPLPDGWTQQTLGLRLASEVYAPWSLNLSVDDELFRFPNSLDEETLGKIDTLIEKQNKSVIDTESLQCKFLQGNTLINFATQEQVAALSEKLDDILQLAETGSFDYVKLIEDTYNGP